jgi:prepilin-type N-terminal cleavage/methylation domain-containing protein
MRRAREAGFTLIELLIVIAIIAIITALASAGLLRSKAAANEASAIQSMRVTSSSQSAYAVACGRGAYAASYLVLGTPPPGGGPGFVPTDLGAGVNPSIGLPVFDGRRRRQYRRPRRLQWDGDALGVLRVGGPAVVFLRCP